MSIFSFGSLLSANVQCGNVFLISGLSFGHVQQNDSSRVNTITASKMNTTAAKQSRIIFSIFTADTGGYPQPFSN
uniref:Uncharacterized protein n=1 Tax=Meloidogyne enterolobii TaxID=390850 RepID=A0A6V7X5A8_MELEN|nr:unnamed protein product [Meloidogyne enterolobii]